MKRDRKKEYELLGKTLVLFEKLTDEIRFKIQSQMVYLGVDLDNSKVQSSMDILLGKTSVDQLHEKFRSIHVVIFSNNHPTTNIINLFCKCMKQLVEFRNLIIHATWQIGYTKRTGTEMYFSRGFNDRYGKNGLSRKVVYFQITKFSKIIKCIETLVKFISDYDILTNQQKIEVSKDINEDRLKEICKFFEEYHKKMKVFTF